MVSLEKLRKQRAQAAKKLLLAEKKESLQAEKRKLKADIRKITGRKRRATYGLSKEKMEKLSSVYSTAFKGVGKGLRVLGKGLVGAAEGAYKQETMMRKRKRERYPPMF